MPEDDASASAVVSRRTSWRAVAASGLLHAAIIATAVVLTLRNTSESARAVSLAPTILRVLAVTLLLVATYRSKPMAPTRFGFAVMLLGVLILLVNQFPASQPNRAMWTVVGAGFVAVGGILLAIAAYAIRNGTSNGNTPSSP
jgi:hydrogenase-4 membrane subunit HyfE